MLLVFSNVFNATSDSVVVIRGVRMNIADLNKDILQGAGYVGPHVAQGLQPILLTPFGAPSAVQQMPAYLRAKQLFSQTGLVTPIEAMSTWPDNDMTLTDLPSKFGLAATTPCLNADPKQVDQNAPRAHCVVFMVIPKPGDPIVVTKVELLGYTAQGPNGGKPPQQQAMFMPDGKTVLWDVNIISHAPGTDPNAPKNMALFFSTYTVDANHEALLQEDYFSLTSSTPTGSGPMPSAPGLGKPATQIFLLPQALRSRLRDFLNNSGQLQGIPGTPVVLYDMIVGPSLVVPTYRGCADFSGAELAFDEAHLTEFEKNKRLFTKCFVFMTQAMLGEVEWDDPELGISVNMKFDMSGE